ncbi:glutamate decarboxylase [Budvicia aquatica]|uniref:Glutamate decarboxylase n=1 Tax=Budvicia aquatica TaxID=82979 RepID=A0A2C6DMZ0_9GAMM|nr:glutamate decarboxylase [Budvicia aquatica]
MTVAVAKSVIAFGILIMALNLSRLTTETMKISTGHRRTLRAAYIHTY